MDWLINLKNTFLSTWQYFSLFDVLDIVILAVIIYKGLKLLKETRGGQLIKGIAVLMVAYIVVREAELKTLTFILEKTFEVGLVALVVMFQPELRRILEKVGNAKVSQLSVFSSGDMSDEAAVWLPAIDAVVDACEDLSATTTGALIVIERQTKLGEQIETGTILNAVPSKELFGNIFYPKTPLHDGAVIIRDGIVLAAACFLPKPQKEELINKQLGSRHRAAIGMSENSDAVVIIVSEETGTISVAENGAITRGFSRDGLKKLLRSRILPEKQPIIDKDKKSAFRRNKVK